MIQLYYFPGNASLAVHVLLEELGVPFELLLVDRPAAAHKSPEYLKLNPNGLIPVLVDGDLASTRRSPSACFSPIRIRKRNSRRRSPHPSERISTNGSCGAATRLQAMLMHYFYGSRMVDEGDAPRQRR